MTRRIIGILIIIFGLSILLGDLVIKLAIASALVYWGVRMLSGTSKAQNTADTKMNSAPTTNADYLNEVVIFGPLDKVIKSENFKGGKIVAIFGSGDVDISQVKTLQTNIDLEFVAVFGGGRLIVPKDWKVNSRGTAVAGNYSNRAPGGAGNVTLNVNGSAVMASIEIVN